MFMVSLRYRNVCAFTIEARWYMQSSENGTLNFQLVFCAGLGDHSFHTAGWSGGAKLE